MPATKPLTFTWVYKYDPGELLPEEGRAAWLEKYGVPPDRAEVQVTLPLTTWEALGFVIQPHGVVNITTCPSSYKYDRPSKFALRVALAFARASIQAGVVPGTFPGEAFCAAYRGSMTPLVGREFYGEYLAKTDKLGADVPNPVSHVAYGYATQMCILVANPDHSIEPGTGNCWALP